MWLNHGYVLFICLTGSRLLGIFQTSAMPKKTTTTTVHSTSTSDRTEQYTTLETNSTDTTGSTSLMNDTSTEYTPDITETTSNMTRNDMSSTEATITQTTTNVSSTTSTSTQVTSTGPDETSRVTRSQRDEPSSALTLNTETILIIVGVVCGFLIVTIIIGIACFRLGRSRNDLGKRYHVESRLYRDGEISPAISSVQYNVEPDISELPNSSPGIQNPDKTNINRSDSEKLRTEKQHKKSDNTNDEKIGVELNLTDQEVKFKAEHEIKNSSNHAFVINRDIDDANTKNLSNVANRSTNCVRVDQKTFEEHTDNMRHISNENNICNPSSVPDYSDKKHELDEDEVYVDASSERLATNTANPEQHKESLPTFVTMSTGEELYDFALPIDNENDNIVKTKDLKQLDNPDDDHYDVSKFDIGQCSPKNVNSHAHAGDVTSHNDTVDDTQIYENDAKNSNTLPENKMDDDYDNTLSSSDTKHNDELYDSAKGDDYDITRHDGSKRFMIQSKERLDNYDHCILPSKDEDYDIVVLQEE